MFIHHQDHRIYCERFGNGTPVLLIHGLTNLGRAWGPQIGSLVDAGHEVLVFDLPGHGLSSPVTRTTSVDDMAATIVAVLDALIDGLVDIVGVSLGGMIAMQVARDFPARVRRLVVANSFDSTATPKFNRVADEWQAELAELDGPVRRLTSSWPALVNARFRNLDAGSSTYRSWLANAASSDGQSLRHVIDGMRTFDVSQRLVDVPHPTLVIGSSADEISSPDASARIAAALPDSQEVLLLRAAHVSNIDSANQFNNSVVRHFSSHIAGPVTDLG